MDTKKGRGHLSRMRMLHRHVPEIVEWAHAELLKNQRTQEDIREEFNEKIEAFLKDNPDMSGEVEPISSSSFNRYSITEAKHAYNIEMMTHAATSLSKLYTPETSDDAVIALVETMKAIIFRVISDKGHTELDPKELMQLANALQRLQQAQNISTQRKKAHKDEFAKQACEAIDQTAQLKGISKDAANSIKAKILGITNLEE